MLGFGAVEGSHVGIVPPSPTVSKGRRMLDDGRMLAAAFRMSLAIRWALGHHQDLRELLAAVDARAARRAPRRWWGEPGRVPVAVARCFRLDDRSCVGRSLTTYALLRGQGYEPSFVSGVAVVSSGGSSLDGHAWVELDGLPLDPIDQTAAVRFREIVRHPATA